MQPDRFEMIFRRLMDLTERVCLSLNEADPGVLHLLAEEHDLLLEEFRQTQIPVDARCVSQLQLLDSQVTDVISKIRRSQQEISSRIKEIGDGKKLFRAYST